MSHPTERASLCCCEKQWALLPLITYELLNQWMSKRNICAWGLHNRLRSKTTTAWQIKNRQGCNRKANLFFLKDISTFCYLYLIFLQFLFDNISLWASSGLHSLSVKWRSHLFMVPSNLNIPKVCDFRGYTLGAERRGYGGIRDDSKHVKLVLGELGPSVAPDHWGRRWYSKMTSQMMINVFYNLAMLSLL